jgi:hypothetical protein
LADHDAEIRDVELGKRGLTKFMTPVHKPGVIPRRWAPRRRVELVQRLLVDAGI